MSKPTIILVHGSWHWGGCYQKLANLLAASGYPVLTPDLASHGYDATPWQKVGSMDDYTKPVQALLEKIEGRAILVGHSMGGVSLTHLAGLMPEKIACLVYLTAFMTPVGKSANDYIFSYATNPVAASLFAVLAPVEDGAGLALDTSKPDQVRDAFYNDCSDTDVRVARANVVTVNTSVPNIYVPKGISRIERHYITCAQDHAIPLDVQREMINAVPGAKVHALKTSHSPFFSAPNELAAILRTIAAPHTASSRPSLLRRVFGGA